MHVLICDPEKWRAVLEALGEMAGPSPSVYIDGIGGDMSCQPCGCDPEANHVCHECRLDGAKPSVITSEICRVSTSETRIVDPTTGGEKGQKLQRFSLIPFDWLWEMATHFGRGAKKYADRNWERGYAWSLSYDAHSRHMNQWLRGERIDAETGSHHLIAAAWHLIVLWWFERHQKGTNDLTPKEGQ